MVLRLTSAGDPAIVLDSADDAVLMVVMPMRVS
jgi:DNA polymerase III sliding clamp (beta) subunit (PCNA family)